MTRDEFAKLVGDTIAHCSYEENTESIGALGLLPAADLAAAGGMPPASLILREDSTRFLVNGRSVRLNHQRPLRKGREQSFLESHTLETWSSQLDRRVFFLPHGRASADHPFTASLGSAVVTFLLDARAFFDTFAPNIWLSPINSGNADRRAAKRGDWIYVDVIQSAEAFRLNRVRRDHVVRPDKVPEVSICGTVPPTLLERLLIG